MIENTETVFAANEQRRQALQDTVRTFTRRLPSPDELAHSVTETTRSGLSNVSSSLRARPIPCALTAIGLVWLIAGSGRSGAKPASTRALSRWEDEGGPSLPPEEDAAQIHGASPETGELSTLALGAGAMAVGALMADALRRGDPLRGKADQHRAAALVCRKTTAALNETEKAFHGLIGEIGKGLIDEAQGALDRYMKKASDVVETVSATARSGDTA
jgi:hypothetical protein